MTNSDKPDTGEGHPSVLQALGLYFAFVAMCIGAVLAAWVWGQLT